ncbi:MAG: DUF5329 family protein [Gammaproteobacteria bacterium]
MHAQRRTWLNPGAGVASRQSMPVHPACWLVLTVLMGLLLAVPARAAAQQTEDLDATIQYLIGYVRESDVTFERNISRHDPVAAAAHIEKKYQYFRDKIDTPEQFIALCATASLMTGKQYHIIDGQGDEIPAGEWLNNELARYRLQTAQQ